MKKASVISSLLFYDSPQLTTSPTYLFPSLESHIEFHWILEMFFWPPSNPTTQSALKGVKRPLLGSFEELTTCCAGTRGYLLFMARRVICENGNSYSAVFCFCTSTISFYTPQTDIFMQEKDTAGHTVGWTSSCSLAHHAHLSIS